MVVRARDVAVTDIVAALDKDRVWFGSGPFSGLLARASVVLSPDAAADVTRSLEAVWGWHRSWQALYADLFAVEADHPIVRLCEWGLSAEQVRVQRRTALAGSLPSLVRLDAVSAVPSVQVAEAQWKGGGEGFLAGVDAAYRALCPKVPGEGPTSSLFDMWVDYYAALADGGCTVSVVRAEWADADRAFADRLRARGVHVIVATPAELDAGLAVRDGRAWYRTHDGEVALAALRSDRLADTITGRRLDDLLSCADGGAVVLDPPPSYLCAEKLGMALPFDPRYASYFSDDARRCLIPSVLVTDPPDCRALVEPLAMHGGAALAELASWDDVPRLPRSVRSRLVVKCGSANPMWNQGGRGVWKLGGTSAAVERVWRTVLARARTGREAWVLQPYVDQTWPVDLYHPDHPHDPHPTDAHVRLLLYGRRHGDVVTFAGGGANFGPFWKVSGKSARWSSSQRLEGSAFCDLRVAQPSR